MVKFFLLQIEDDLSYKLNDWLWISYFQHVIQIKLLLLLLSPVLPSLIHLCGYFLQFFLIKLWSLRLLLLHLKRLRLWCDHLLILYIPRWRSNFSFLVILNNFFSSFLFFLFFLLSFNFHTVVFRLNCNLGTYLNMCSSGFNVLRLTGSVDNNVSIDRWRVKILIDGLIISWLFLRLYQNLVLRIHNLLLLH